MTSPIRELSDAFPDAVVVVDSQGKAIAANAQAVSLFGYDEREITNMTVKALFPGQLLAVPRQRSGRQDSGRYFEVVGTRSDSTRFPAVAAWMPVLVDHFVAAVLTIRVIAESQSAQFVLSRGLETLIWEGQDRQALLRYLIRAREEERARIAADIHDDAIQVISAASLRARSGILLDLKRSGLSVVSSVMVFMLNLLFFSHCHKSPDHKMLPSCAASNSFSLSR